MRKLTTVLVAGMFLAVAFAARPLAQEKKGKGLQLTDLPAAVQKTVQENLKGGQIKSIGKEKEDGVEQYEIESVLGAKARDFNIDVTGKLLVMEEATTLSDIPAAAKAAIVKKVGTGTLRTVETFAKPGQPLMYEAAYKDARGKTHEVLVKADGTEAKQ